MNLAQNAILLMALGTVVLDVALVVKVLALFHGPSRAQIRSGGARFGLLAIFLLSTAALAGTLFLQYADNLAPCVLCWWQRVFMYPIPLISLIAILKRQTIADVADYILALSILGAAVALYQHLLQVLPQGALVPCDAAGDCAVRSVFEFGFVTLPWMSLTVFAITFVIALVARKQR